MNHQFDELTKNMAQAVTRRAAFKKFGVGLAGMALACFGLASKAGAKISQQMLAGLTVSATLFCLSTHAQGVIWEVSAGGNGHMYRPVPGFDGLTWTMADQLARAEGGYLATITSPEENAFVFSLVDAPQFWRSPGNGSGPAIGGFQQDGALEPAGGWAWVTGESWNYTSWLPGQPDNYPGGLPEDRMHFFSGSDGVRAAIWNDIGRDDMNLGGFVIEMVPEPSAVFLFGLAASPLVVRVIRKNRALSSSDLDLRTSDKRSALESHAADNTKQTR